MTDLSRDIETYVLDHTDPEDALLHELNRYTHLNVVHPRMLSGQLQGKILRIFSLMIQPANILEIGTFTGYSALNLAYGLKPGGKLVTIENNDEIAEIANKFFNKSSFKSQIELHTGDARKIIPELNISFDLVFMDAEKSEYIQYFELFFPKIPVGGFILADNVLWSGKVVQQDEPNNDYFTKGIKAFNEMVKNDPRVEKVLLPVRDGIYILRKISD